MDTNRECGQTESCRSPAVQISAMSAKLGQSAAGQARHDGRNCFAVGPNRLKIASKRAYIGIEGSPSSCERREGKNGGRALACKES